METATRPPGVPLDSWAELLLCVRDEIAEAVEKTIAQTPTMRSYDGLAPEAIHELVSGSYDVVLDGLDQRRRPDERADGRPFGEHRESRGRPGVGIREMFAVW